VLEALQASDFRRRFALGKAERYQLRENGLEVTLAHARQFVDQRLAPAEPPRDGKQTPMRGHPVFIAQHATATCCRGCLQRWHGIRKGRALDEAERAHVLAVLRLWLEAHLPAERARQPGLFDDGEGR